MGKVCLWKCRKGQFYIQRGHWEQCVLLFASSLMKTSYAFLKTCYAFHHNSLWVKYACEYTGKINSTYRGAIENNAFLFFASSPMKTCYAFEFLKTIVLQNALFSMVHLCVDWSFLHFHKHTLPTEVCGSVFISFENSQCSYVFIVFSFLWCLRFPRWKWLKKWCRLSLNVFPMKKSLLSARF